MSFKKYIVLDDFSFNTKIFNKGMIFDQEATKFDSQTIAWLKCNESIADYYGQTITENKEEEIVKEEEQPKKKKKSKK